MTERSAGASRRPNVLFIMADQWPGSLLGAAGHRVVSTPTLDHLAQLGTRFTRAYAECPVCIPARRTVMTGTPPRTHGDRVFQPALPMPALTTLAQAFRDAGYQAVAVGKLHVYPPRDRIGFDDVWLAEEGRPQLGAIDDYDMFLADRGFAGRQFLHAMSNNDYVHRTWHLPEECHVTNWITETMARAIKRRDPTRPAFWHLSYTHPHPPLAPLAAYTELYRDAKPDAPLIADWARVGPQPHALRAVRDFWPARDGAAHGAIRRAFHALCTHIDHQLRVVLGTLREEGLLDDTIILFTADHGDMLGDFGLWAKRLFYEGSANLPMILVGAAHDSRVVAGCVDDRLVGLQDVMPTLLDLAGVPKPPSVEGLSMLGPRRRDTLFGESREDAGATRMVHDGRYKLIWYPAGNHVQLFDLEDDPRETRDRAGDARLARVRARLEATLVEALYGGDLAWLEKGRLKGFDPGPYQATPDRGFFGQRGLHYPPPPPGDPAGVVGTPG